MADQPARERSSGPSRVAMKRARTRRSRILLVTAAVVIAGVAILAWQLLGSGSTAAPGHALAGSSSPAVPVGLRAVEVSSTRVTLNWSPQAAGPTVTYQVYRDGKAIGTSTKTSFLDHTVRPATTYTYAITALTAAGQPGRLGPAVTVTTPKVRKPAQESVLAAFPDGVNTGYQKAPGYPGHLTDCSHVAIRSDSTYKYCDFPDGVYIGSAGSHPVNVSFIGCRFASNAVGDANVADYGDGISFSYVTFEPSTVPASSEPASPHAQAVALGQGYQYGIDQRYAGSLTVNHADFWGFEEAIQFGDSSQAKQVIIKNSWFHNSRDPGTSDHTDGILENYGGLSYMTFDHNTIVGNGNTNALALQGSQPYDHVTITRNYFSGYGYMVNSGANGSSTHMVFTDNVWGTDIEPTFGPLYGDTMYTTPGLGGVWHGNTIYVRPGTTWMAAGNNGLHWWPTDGNPSSPSQIIGHSSDYPGP